MELTLRTVFWTVQIVGFLIPPLVLFVILGKQKERRKFAAVLSLVLLAVMLISATALTLHPPVINVSHGDALEDADKAAVRHVSSGIYSMNIPIFPIAAVVTEHTDGILRWRTYYAFWGSVEHICDINTGMYECTDYLTGW